MIKVSIRILCGVGFIVLSVVHFGKCEVACLEHIYLRQLICYNLSVKLFYTSG